MKAAFNIAAIICAAGTSSRMGGLKKEYRLLSSRGEKPLTVLGAAVSAFASCPQITPIVITLPEEANAESTAFACLPRDLQTLCGPPQSRILFVSGGPTRRASVYNALMRLEEYDSDYVLIHDGARPWVKKELIEDIIEAVIRHEAVIPALPLTETPKELSPAGKSGFSHGELGFVKRHLKRAEICTAQTPQAFIFQKILSAHKKAAETVAKKSGLDLEGFEYTDDAEVWGEFIGKVAVIPGNPENRKITYPEDLGGL